MNIFLFFSGITAFFSGLFAGFSGGLEWVALLLPGGGAALTLAMAVAAYSDIPEEVRAIIRRWHGGINDQFLNIDNVVVTLEAHKEWGFVPDVLATLKAHRDELQKLIIKCNGSTASSVDRMHRNTTLKKAVAICLTRVKGWTFMQFYEGLITEDDVHQLGFFLPGETSGHRDRKDPTSELPDVKVAVNNMDNIRVIIDQSNEENAALVRHGWPKGVRHALIVILTADGVTEVVRQMTTNLHTRIEMPAGSRGQTFIAKAAFLRHVDDTPQFSREQATFTMPQTTEDLGAIIDKQHHEEFEEHVREVERRRLEVERLEKLRKAQK
jgi:hypothetical protein